MKSLTYGLVTAALAFLATCVTGENTNTYAMATRPRPRQQGALSVTPTGSFTAAGPVAGPFAPATKAYTLSNTGALPISVAISVTNGWLDADVAATNLAAGASAVVTLLHAPAAFALQSSTNTSQVAFENLTNGRGNATRTASLIVTNVAPSEPSMNWTNVARGTFILDTNDSGGMRTGLFVRVATYSNIVDGVRWRKPNWRDFAFSELSNAVLRLQAIRADATMVLAVSATLQPASVVSAATHKYNCKLPGGSSSGSALTGAPWDTVVKAEWRDFNADLFGRGIYDVNAGTTVPVSNHSAIALVEAAIPGPNQFREFGTSPNRLVDCSGYTRTGFVDSVKYNIHSVADVSGDKPLHVAIFNIPDSQASPSLLSALSSALAAEFDGSSRTRRKIGFFQEGLNANFGSGYPYSGTGGDVAGALSTWFLTYAMPVYEQDGYAYTDTASLSNSFVKMQAWGCTYVERYDANIRNAAMTAEFLRQHALIWGN